MTADWLIKESMVGSTHGHSTEIRRSPKFWRGDAAVQDRERRACGRAGMQECPVSHNSAKLEVKCAFFLRPGLLFSFGGCESETRSRALIELLSLSVGELDVAFRLNPGSVDSQV